MIKWFYNKHAVKIFRYCSTKIPAYAGMTNKVKTFNIYPQNCLKNQNN